MWSYGYLMAFQLLLACATNSSVASFSIDHKNALQGHLLNTHEESNENEFATNNSIDEKG